MSGLNYKTKIQLAHGLAAGGAIVTGLAAARIAQASAPGENLGLILPLLLIVAGLGCVSTLPWWRSIDDVQRQGHLVSWFWGSMAGAWVLIMAFVAVFGRTSDLARGAGALYVAQGVGFCCAYLIWRWRGRDSGE